VGTAVFYDGRYTYLHGGADHKNELYDLKNDPMQKKNLIRKDRKRAEKMHRRFIRWCEELDCPEEYLKHRREFSI
jgi:transposase-like protein